MGGHLGRIDNLAGSGSPAHANKYAAYTFLGAGTMAQVASPKVNDQGNALTLSYGTGGSYISSIAVTTPQHIDFGVGEFGIATRTVGAPAEMPGASR